MTRVCVEWSRPETARLIARCREALAASDETAKAATPDTVAAEFHANYERLAPIYGYKTRDASSVLWEQVPKVNRDLMVATVMQVYEGPFPRLALNQALRAVLDGIAATLSQDYQSRLHDVEHALTSLAAIAAALGVQDEAS